MIPALEGRGAGGSEHLVQHDLRKGVATLLRNRLCEEGFAVINQTREVWICHTGWGQGGTPWSKGAVIGALHGG